MAMRIANPKSGAIVRRGTYARAERGGRVLSRMLTRRAVVLSFLPDRSL